MRSRHCDRGDFLQRKEMANPSRRSHKSTSILVSQPHQRIEYDDIQADISAPDISAPRVIKRVEPRYTDEAKQARVVGTVILRSVIQTNGSADILKVVKPLPFGLTESALEALQQWRFMPAVRNGKEIPVAATIEVAFNLGETYQRDVCR
jgi:TonB family protein